MSPIHEDSSPALTDSREDDDRDSARPAPGGEEALIRFLPTDGELLARIE